jgi:hypothetical protein
MGPPGMRGPPPPGMMRGGMYIRGLILCMYVILKKEIPETNLITFLHCM